ncbi:tryptophan synthase subunit beta, partial [Aquicoccus sp. SCR17]|nr:tryptophan synthase subunit beta [Carideicomes alvinocaridis]
MTHRTPEDNALRGATEPRTLAEACDLVTTPDLDVSADGMFGQYGGAHLPPQLAG